MDGENEHRRCWVLPATELPPQFNEWGINMLTAIQYDRVKGVSVHAKNQVVT